MAIHNHQDAQHYYVVQDLLRSVRGLVRKDGGQGTWVAAWRYRLYGEVLLTDGGVSFPLRFRWAGAQLDEETGLYNLRSRYYSPAFGRFIQEDPIGFAGGLNLYAYGAGDPSSQRDPDGLYMGQEPQYHPDPSLFAVESPFLVVGSGAAGFSDWDGDGIDDDVAFFVSTSGYDEYERNARGLRQDHWRDTAFDCVSGGPCAQALRRVEYERLVLTGLREDVFTDLSYRDAVLSYVQQGRLFTADDHTWFGGAPMQTVGTAYTVATVSAVTDLAGLRSGLTANRLVHEWLHTRGIDHGSPVNNCTVADRVTTYPYGQGACR